MIRFEKSLVEGITEIKRPTEFSFRNYSIYNLELARISRFNFENTELSTCEKKKKEREKREVKWNPRCCLLPSSSIPVQLFARISASFPLYLERLIYFAKMCI